MEVCMPFKNISLILFVALLFALLAPFSVYSTSKGGSYHSDDIATEVIVTIQDDKILAFSAYSGNWVAEDIKLTERVLRKKSQGNIGIVVTTKRILGFSVITEEWTPENLKINEIIEEIKVEGNVATMKTDVRVIGFSAHTGKWTEAPQ
jgi:hypothetical protein